MTITLMAMTTLKTTMVTIMTVAAATTSRLMMTMRMITTTGMMGLYASVPT